MNKIKSNPPKSILVIIVGLLIINIFYPNDLLLYSCLLLALIGSFSNFLSSKVESIWFGTAYILGLIIPKIILISIFYLFLFPLSILSRISRNDLLNLKNSSDSVFKDSSREFTKKYFHKTW